MNKKLTNYIGYGTHKLSRFLTFASICLCLTFDVLPVQASVGSVITTRHNIVTTSEGFPIECEDYNIEDILLPRNLYILRSNDTSEERFNVYFKNAVLTNSSTYKVYAGASAGQTLVGRWLYKSTGLDEVTANQFDLTLTVAKDTNESNIMTKTTTAHIVDKDNANPVRLMAIGDSLTRAGIYLTEVKNSLPNVETIGTRVYPGEDYPREGRGGWTLEKYFTSINSSDLDSPFVFPTTVSGSHYKGNTRDWKNICYTNPNHHLYNGFQKIARGWKDEGEYLYDENGYYKYPTLGDVMVDPTLPEGEQWVEWDGLIWRTMPVQPTEFEFNFTKYMERFAAAFPTGAPTHVSILLGSNDFGTTDGFVGVESFLDYYQKAIDSIHAYDPTIKIIICTPPLGPNENLITDTLGQYTRYDRNTKLAAYYLMKQFDTAENEAKNIHIAPMTLNLDSTNGFDYKQTEQEINGVTKTITVPSNGIHPNNQFGQLQMGDTLAAVIQSYR